MSGLYVGTASWTDKSLLDSRLFYPARVRTAEDRLRFYASQFPVVEVDSSYYALPTAETAALWAARTPSDFTFNVKAFRLFTGHQTPPVALPPDIRTALQAGVGNVYYKDVPEELLDEMWRRFRQALGPLQQAGKLGLVHFQFAPWVMFGTKSLRHIERCSEHLEGFRLAVEFRHRSWFDDERSAETLAFERAHALVNTVVDAPAGFHNSVPAVWEATRDDFALVRLHGRNHHTWNMKGLTSSAQRFNYDYSDAELAELSDEIVTLSGKVGTTHVIFNNNFEDQGMRNARSLIGVLRARAARLAPHGDAKEQPEPAASVSERHSDA